MARATEYSDDLTRGQRARETLAREQYTEYSAFTGTDIKAFILPQGDQVARKEAERRLVELDRALQESSQSSQQEAFKVNPEAVDGTHASNIAETITGQAASPMANDLLPLVNLQSITISTFRAKSQVRALGHVNAVGLARGSRTVAGTFILTEFNKDAFWDVLTGSFRDINVGDTGMIQPDQMRPFDLMLLFAHEMGNIAIRHVYGVEVVTNGVVYSIQDYYSENTVSYIAQDVSPLIPLSPAMINGRFTDMTGSRLKLNNLITTVRGATLDADFAYLKNARNPFI